MRVAGLYPRTKHQLQLLTAIADQLYLLANGKLHAVQSPADLEKFGYIRRL